MQLQAPWRQRLSLLYSLLYPQKQSFINNNVVNKRTGAWEFPARPVVGTSPSTARGILLIPPWEAKWDPTCLMAKTKNMKQKQCFNKFGKD